MKMGLFYSWQRLRRTLNSYRRQSAITLSLMMAASLLLILTGCGGRADAAPVPPKIHYGEDICEFCGMIISEERFAAGYITHDGQEHIFDDIGDMFKAHLSQPTEVIAFFVHDYDSSDWIRAESAYYVLAEELLTPMSSGLAACSSAERATALAADFKGQVLAFDELLANYRQAGPIMKAMHGQDHQHD